MLYVGVSEGCLEGVWEVSEGCLSDSGYCLGGYDLHAINKHPIDSSSLVYSFTGSCLGLVKMWGCLWGVWEVSGRCLGVV